MPADGSKLPRRFHLVRNDDVSGVSGVGTVAHGCEFINGLVALSFVSPYPHVNIYANMKVLNEVHGHGGKTTVVYDD